MKWSILILTLPQRADMLKRLLKVLKPQITRDVELRIETFDARLPVGENRELMRRLARGEYISFIDDDDLVPGHFVERILPALDGVDYVGFNLEQRIDGAFACIECHSLRYAGVGRTDSAHRWRDISHLNPMRRELALLVPMTGWPAEDSRWADGIRSLGVLKTEHYFDEVLYHYLSRTVKPELGDTKFLVSVEADPCLWRLMKKVKVRMLTGIAGLPNPMYDLPEHGYAPGDIVELHPALANAWIEAHIAEAIPEEKPKPVKGKAAAAEAVEEESPVAPPPGKPKKAEEAAKS